jgi:hypothetical protein
MSGTRWTRRRTNCRTHDDATQPATHRPRADRMRLALPGRQWRLSHRDGDKGVRLDPKGKGFDQGYRMADREAGTVIDRDRQTIASRRSMGVGAIFSAREGGGRGGMGGRGV